MLPVRVLVVGRNRVLLRRIRRTLESEGYLVILARGSVVPAVLLARTAPDLLIAEIPPARTSIETWRRAIESSRARRPFSVLALTMDAPGEDERRALEEIADLGVAERPIRRRDFLRRLDDWYESEAPQLRAG